MLNLSPSTKMLGVLRVVDRGATLYVRGAADRSPTLPAAVLDSLGAAVLGAAGFWRSENGRYRITKIYDDENWNPDLRARSPPGVDVRVGDYISRSTDRS
jgi:hypothetical protein